MKYHAVFYGRQKGAIGIFYPIETTVEGDTLEQARLNLYERFEHIQRLTLTVWVRCLSCGWLGTVAELKAEACPRCDSQVAEEGSAAYDDWQRAANARLVAELTAEAATPLLCECCGEPAGAGGALCPACAENNGVEL